MLKKMFLMSVLLTGFASVQSNCCDASRDAGLLTDIGRWCRQSCNTVWGNRNLLWKTLFVVLAARVVYKRGVKEENKIPNVLSANKRTRDFLLSGICSSRDNSKAWAAGKAVIGASDFNARVDKVVEFPFALGQDALDFGHEMAREAVDRVYWVCSAVKKGVSSTS